MVTSGRSATRVFESRIFGKPHFRYCCSVWGCCGATKLQTLQKLQNRAARIVTKSKFDTPAMALIHNLNWPTINEIIRSETATNMYKSLNGLVPEYLSNFFVKNSTRNVRELRNTEADLSLPLRKTKNGQKQYPFVDLSFGMNSNLILNRHPPLPPSKKD